MSRLSIAALIWLGVDIFLALIAAPAIVLVEIPGLVRAWGRHDLVYMIDILIPNVMLMIVPGAIMAGVYLFVASRIARG